MGHNLADVMRASAECSNEEKSAHMAPLGDTHPWETLILAPPDEQSCVWSLPVTRCDGCVGQPAKSVTSQVTSSELWRLRCQKIAVPSGMWGGEQTTDAAMPGHSPVPSASWLSHILTDLRSAETFLHSHAVLDTTEIHSRTVNWVWVHIGSYYKNLDQ